MIKVIESLEGLYIVENNEVFGVGYKVKNGDWKAVILKKELMEILVDVIDDMKNEK